MLSAGASGKTPVHLVGIQPYDGGAGAIGFNVEPAILMALEHIEAANWLPNHTFVVHTVCTLSSVCCEWTRK